MKKFIYSFAALMMMVCTAVIFSSCSDDDDKTVSCTVVWADAAYASGAQPSASEATVVDRTVASMNSRTAELVGATFNLASEDGKTPTLEARNTLRNKLVSDTELTAMVQSLANYKVASIVFYLKSADGTTTMYQEVFNTNDTK